jgi:hypothetical protein
LFRAALNESADQMDCPRLKGLNESLGSVRKGTVRFGDSAAYESCRSSSCRMMQVARRGLPSCDAASTATVSRCPEPSWLAKRRTGLVRLSGSSTAALVSPVVGPTPAVAVVVVGTAGIALAAAIHAPTSVTKGPALGSLARVPRCAFVDDDTEPSMLDFPIQLPIGSSTFDLFVGSGLLSIGLLVAVPIATALIFGHFGCRSAFGRNVQKKIIANAAILAMGYFGPQAFKLPLLVFWHSTDPLERAIAILCPVLTLVGLIPLLVAVVRHFDSAVIVFDSPELEFNNRHPESLFIETYGLLFDAARSTRMHHRLLYFEDLLVASVLQLLDGFRPERDTSCGIVASIMAGVCWFHTIYLLFVRPFSDPLELGLAILGSLLMSTMASLGLSVAFGISETNVEESSYYVAFTYLGLCCMCYFFFQSAILAIAGAIESIKKRSKGNTKGPGVSDERITGLNGSSQVAASGEAGMAHRLVQIPPSSSRAVERDPTTDIPSKGRPRRDQGLGLLLAAPLLEEGSTRRRAEHLGHPDLNGDSEEDDDESSADDPGNDHWRSHPSGGGGQLRSSLTHSQPNPLGRGRLDLQTPIYRRR